MGMELNRCSMTTPTSSSCLSIAMTMGHSFLGLVALMRLARELGWASMSTSHFLVPLITKVYQVGVACSLVSDVGLSCNVEVKDSPS